MDTNDTLQLALQDPLSDVTRRERKVLLGVSAIALVVSQTGMVPTKLSALGIEFGASDQRALLQVFSAVIVYFTVAFIIYGASDYLQWRLRYDSARRALFLAHQDKIENLGLDEYMPDDPWTLRGVQRASPMVSVARGLFEFLLPITVAIAAVYLLLSHSLAEG